MGTIILYISYVMGFFGWAFLLSYLLHDIFWGVTVALAMATALVLYKVMKKKPAGETEEYQPEETLLDVAKREAGDEREREQMRRAAMAQKEFPDPDAVKQDAVKQDADKQDADKQDADKQDPLPGKTE